MRWRNIVWGQQQMRFWLEWDRGTMNVRDLVIKFTSYAFYIASREWAREHSMLPVLICVAPDIAQERRVQRVAQDRLTRSAGLIVWTTTEALFNEHGSSLPHLVTRSSTAKSNCKAGQTTQTMPIRYNCEKKTAFEMVLTYSLYLVEERYWRDSSLFSSLPLYITSKSESRYLSHTHSRLHKTGSTAVHGIALCFFGTFVHKFLRS